MLWPDAASFSCRFRRAGAHRGPCPHAVKVNPRHATYRDVQLRNETQQKFLAVVLNNLDKMSAERTERVTVARTDTGPPWSLWTVQFLTSAMVLGYAIIFGGQVVRRASRDGGGLGSC